MGVILTFFIFAMIISTILLIIGLVHTQDKAMTIIGVIGFFISLIVLGNFVPQTTIISDTYYLPCELVAVNNDVKFFEDESGNIWQWEDDKYYSMDTLYLLTMNANSTYTDKTDDIVQVVWQLGGEEVDNSVG